MRAEEYRAIYGCEDFHWWYRSLRALIEKEAEGLAVRRAADIGCGAGGNLDLLHRLFPKAEIYGIDPFESAVEFSGKRNCAHLVRARGENLPLPSNSVDLLLSMDVLSQEAVGVPETLGEARRVLRPGGRLLVNLPAFECLRGSHDKAVSTVRRFRLEELREESEQAGFRVKKIYYWNSLLFLPALALRRWTRFFPPRGGQSDLAGPRIWNGLLEKILSWERPFSRSGIFPFGTSVFAACEKPL